MQRPIHFAEQPKTSNFDNIAVLNEVHNNYKFIKGKLVLKNRQPDGDSVAFIADNPVHFNDVYRSYLLKPSKVDGSVQLRFEGIDTPELHFNSEHQPFGKEARDFLLKDILGFKDIRYKPVTGEDNPEITVDSSSPESVPAIIATNALETHGRPIAYVFLNVEKFTDGATTPLEADSLLISVNHQLLLEGWAYLLAYTSMPVVHYHLFREAANKARSQNKGVWDDDATHDFILADRSSIEGKKAQLIYPKLFRRCIEFFKSGEKELKEWLRKTTDENDQVRINQNTIVNFSSLIQQVNDHIYFQGDTNDIVFVEK